MTPTFSAHRPHRFVFAVVLAIASLLFIITALGIAAPAPPAVMSVPSQPSLVSVSGAQLIVQRRKPDNTLSVPQPYTIQGVNWSPAAPCVTQPQLAGQFTAWYTRDVPLMASMGVNTIRTYLDFGQAPTATQILDLLYAHNIMVIMAVDKVAANAANITPTVNAYKDHPAILMWAVGNEWDLNRYYNTFTNTVRAAAFTEWAAQIIHNLDPNHPVASSLGEIDRGASQPLLPLVWSPNVTSTWHIVSQLAPSVDVWGVNIYRGGTFGGLFGQWQQISNKPVFVAEFGADSYDHRINAENQTMQANYDDRLWQEIFRHLAARWPGRATLGGLVFEWNDEWWKQTPGIACLQNTAVTPQSGQPDGYFDEDWFGVVKIGRQPKEGYFALRRNFLSNAVLTLSTSITLSAFSEAYSQFFSDAEGFCRKEGGGGGGRGLNFAIMDPHTGAIEDCRNFDTWQDKQAFVTMTAYISNTIPVGRIVLVAIADEGGFINFNQPGCHTPWPLPQVITGYLALESLGSTLIRDAGYQGSWAMITIKALTPTVLAENYADPIYAIGSCEAQDRAATQITATVPIALVYPGYRNFLPSISNRLP